MEEIGNIIRPTTVLRPTLIYGGVTWILTQKKVRHPGQENNKNFWRKKYGARMGKKDVH